MDSQIQAILDLLSSFPAYIDSREIPNIDLYMDQVTTFMDTFLAGSKRSEEDKTLTKTMINNYVKGQLIPPPNKKKYSKDHMILLLMLYYSKNILSINDIATLLQPISEALFHTEGDFTLQSLYDSLQKQSLIHMEELKEEIASQYEEALKWSDQISDIPKTIEKDFLVKYAFISILGMDISFKKLMIERLIDEMTPSAESKEKKEPKDKKDAKEKNRKKEG